MAARRTATRARRPVKRMRLAERKRRIRLLKLAGVLVLLTLLYAGAVWLLSDERLHINRIIVSGNEALSEQQLSATALQALSTVRLGGISGATIVTYDEARLRAEVLSAHMRVQDAEVHIRGARALALQVREREAVARWCRDERCYLLDGSGLAFAKVMRSDAGVAEGIVYEMRSRAPMLGTHITTHFTELHNFVHRLSGLGVSRVRVDITDDTLVEVHTDTLPVLKIRLADDASLDDAYAYLEITLRDKEYLAYAHQADGGVSYIDLRFGNRVYYK